MLAQPCALLAVAGPLSLDERPEALRVAVNAEMAELVHDHVVGDRERREHEAPVE